MATYGNIPGVQITTGTGSVAGVTIGREQYLTLIGVGNASGSANVNEVVRIEGRDDVDEKFGEESDVASAYRRALSNGANPNYINAIKVETTSQTEVVADTSGTLPNVPAVPELSRITVTDVDADTELDVDLRHGDPIEAPSEEGVLYFDPRSGDYDVQINTTEIEISYESADWSSAITAAKGAIGEGEFGVLMPLFETSSIYTDLQGIVEEMRSNMKMVVGLLPLSLNETDGYPRINTTDLTLPVSDDALFVAGPTPLETLEDNGAYGYGAIGAVGGVFAGNDNTEPIYDNTLTISGLSQQLTRADVTELRDKYVIPLRDTGTVRMKDNHSTYDQETDGGWERDYFRRRIVDLTTVTIYQIARRQLGGILDDDTVDDVADALNAEMSELVEDGLLEPDGQDVEVYRKDDRTIGIDAEITPYGVAKGADVQLDVIA